MSSPAIEQKAYLQKKYISASSGEKKKKKKVFKGKGFKLIDDDIDLSKLRPLEDDELYLIGEGEDAPVVAGIIDERPEEVKKMEQFKTSSKWRVVTKDDGFNSKLQIEELKESIKEVEKGNEIVFGKMYSDSEDDQRNNSDVSPPRKRTEAAEQPKTPSPRKINREQPPLKQSDKKNNKHHSPARKHVSEKRNEKARKTSRWGDAVEPSYKTESSLKSKHESSSTTKDNYRKLHRHLSEDRSPPRKTKEENGYDSDLSPPKKSIKELSKKQNLSTDSDASPPRKSKCSPDRSRVEKYNKEKRNVDRVSSKCNNRHTETSTITRDSDSDMSPPRKSKKTRTPSPQKKSKKSTQYTHDELPTKQDRNIKSRDTNRYKRGSNSPPPSNKKMARTLEGKVAGLQDSRQLREENEAFRRLEDEAFKKLGDDVSGRNAKALSRKGKRETSEERQKLREKAERQKELDEKYKKWNKGLKQVEAQETRAAEFMHEASKPVARYRDDIDLEGRLRGVERAGDPMLDYIRDKKRQHGQLPLEKPMYKGMVPLNRFNIRPGYRWDGVDRSNGYEKKFFEQQAKRKALEEEAYKWSTEDL